MKKIALILLIVLAASVSHAESVWTGNAAVGGTADFPGDSENYRASSNSFPPGTRLQVTNPRGGRSVDVIVTGRLQSPGVFILIEEQAGLNIGLPLDHVVPVRVTPFRDNEDPAIADPGETEGGVSDDTDFNPAASITESDEELKVAEAPAVPEPEAAEEAADSAGALETPPPAADAGSTGELPETAAVPAGELPEAPEEAEDEGSGESEITPEVIITYEFPEPGTAEAPAETSVVEEETAEEGPVDDRAIEESVIEESVIEESVAGEELVRDAPSAEAPAGEPSDGESVFFLMPTDPRPPEPVETAESDRPEAGDDSPDAVSAPLPPADPPVQAVDTGERFVQIGAYRSKAVMDEAAGRIGAAAPGYPLSYIESGSGSNRVYKLVIGPLRPAEVGIVLQTARNTAFPDAFPVTR